MTSKHKDPKTVMRYDHGRENLDQNAVNYCPELISLSDESSLIARVRELPFREFEFHGYVGKRRTVSFGWHYDFVE